MLRIGCALAHLDDDVQRKVHLRAGRKLTQAQVHSHQPATDELLSDCECM
jgi:hypothetical protein